MGIDKVVEAAKAYISRIESEIAKDPAIKPWDEYYILKEALYPPPARPSKEECINKLERYLVEYMHDDVFKSLAKDMLYYLKEPSLQWVKNTGVEPECKTMLVLLKNGMFKLGERADFNFLLENSFDVNNFVELYIVLE